MKTRIAILHVHYIWKCWSPTYDLKGATRCEFKNRSFSWVLAVVRSESYAFVGNAANFLKSFPCKTFGCDKNTVVRKYFLSYIVEHCRTLLNIISQYVVHSRMLSYIHVHLRTLTKCTTKCHFNYDLLQNENLSYKATN